MSLSKKSLFFSVFLPSGLAISNLSVLTTYKIRVTTGVKDSTGNTLSSQYETSNGFTTGTTVDTTAPTVSSTSPADSDTSVSSNRTISVTFSEAIDSASVTTNTSGTTCSGTLQVSSDSFSTCVQMSPSPTVSNSYQTFTVTPSSDLSFLTNNFVSSMYCLIPLYFSK